MLAYVGKYYGYTINKKSCGFYSCIMGKLELQSNNLEILIEMIKDHLEK